MLRNCEKSASEICAVLLKAGIALPEDWDPAGSPTAMLQRVLRRVDREAAEDAPDEYGLQVFVWDWPTVLDRWHFRSPQDPDDPRIVLAVHPYSYSTVEMGPLERRLGPRLFPVLYDSLLYTLVRYIYVWCHAELDMTIEWMEENIDMSGEEEVGADYLEHLAATKASQERFAFKGLPLNTFDGTIEHEDPELAGLVQDAWDLYRLQAAVPHVYHDLEDELQPDWSYPQPPIVLCGEDGDPIVAAFDERYEQDDGCEPAPCHVFVLDPRDPAKLAATWSDFRLFLYVHARTQDLIHRIREVAP